MSFDPNAELDPSQVQDLRGRRGMGSIPGGGLTVGGGSIGIILLILAAIFGGDLTGGGGGSTSTGLDGPFSGLNEQTAQGDPSESGVSQCRTGQDAIDREDCRIVGYINSIQRYWTDEFARRGSRYTPAQTTFYSGSVQTGCGPATSQVGPFYCPADQKVYIDLGFFDELRTRFGAKGGPFAQAYVLAHEYGHHIQNLAGTLAERSGGRGGPQSNAVRVELQADCFAGVWAGNAASTGIITNVSEQEIAQALDAAAAVGDDRIQKEFQGRVTPESWTHGSAAQRQKWFNTGYTSRDIGTCDTFKGSV